ncbi:MAG: M1 family metallopeptidase [Ferruginibacter sp.]
MKQIFMLIAVVAYTQVNAQQSLFMPENIKAAYEKGTRSMDGKPGKNYWQNTGHYNIEVQVSPPSKAVQGSETITYINNSPAPVKNIVIKLIMNIHSPGAARQRAASANYLTTGIHIDEFLENGKEGKIRDAKASTWTTATLASPVATGDSVQLSFKWHYDLSEESGREGKLDSTSFFLAYFYPRVAVYDDTHGWDRMDFTDAQEFYNDFNDYTVAVTVPKNFLVWGTGDLLNAADVLQPAFLSKFNKSLTSDAVINVVTQKDLEAKKITKQNATNTWKWKATHISDMAYCISDQYVWDAASVVVDKATGRRASTQSAFFDKSKNFHNQVEHIRHSLDWYSNNWPGVAYPFPKSTIIEGFADMEYPMMANDSKQDDDVFQRFVAEHEVGHSYFPFYMGINEHRYGFMDEGWTTAFEYMIGTADLGKTAATAFFKQFRVAGWAMNPGDETQVPVITPVNILSGQAMGHNEYGKPALAYLGLKDMLGDDVFKKALQGFMDRWHGKHPIPWDMFNSFSDLSGKNLDWYFGNWFMSTHYMDIAVDKLTETTDGYTLSIKNIGGYPVPTDVMIEYNDETKDTLHQTAGMWEKDPQMTTINIKTKKKISFLKLDGGIWMDADASNNNWGTKKEKELSAAELVKYTGTYATTQIPIKLTFTSEGSKLVVEPTGQQKLILTNTAKDTFEFEAAGLVITFDAGKDELVLKQGISTIPFKKEK